MSQALLEKSPLALEFEQAAAHLPGGDIPWVERLRARSFERFAQAGFPLEKAAGWKSFPVAALKEPSWRLADFPIHIRASEIRKSSLLSQEDYFPLSFFNGHYFPDLNAPRSEGFVAAGLAALLKNNPELFENFWGHRPVGALGAFEALNGAFFQDGAAIVLPKDFSSPKPVHLFFSGEASADFASMSHPLNLIALGPGSRVTIIQEFAGGGGLSLTNAVTEIFLDEGANLDLIIIEREGADAKSFQEASAHASARNAGAGAFNLQSLAVHQARNSHFSCTSVFLGESSSRQELGLELDGEDAECILNGLYRSSDSQSKNILTTVTHAKPRTKSNELYKGILEGRGRAAFEGLVVVKPDAQKTDASLYNKNLVLSEEAAVHTSPEFKIEADDVRCKHGSAIGQLDLNALFYLKSRGFGDIEARAALIHAFQSEIVDSISLEPARVAVMKLLAEKSGLQEALE